MKKFKFIIPVLLLCFVFIFFAQQTNVAYAASEQTEVKVFGSFVAKIKADKAEVYISIENLGKTQEEAKNLTLETFQKLSAELEEKFSSKLKINNFYTHANLDRYDSQNIVGYTAKLSCCVDLEDLSNLVDLFDVSAKHNACLNYLNYYSTRAQEEYMHALVEAKNNAIENAKNLMSSDIKLLEVKEISQFYCPYEYRSLNGTANNFDLNAEIEISATVQIECETI